MKLMHVVECGGGVDKYLEMLLPLLQKDFEQILTCSHSVDAKKYQGVVDCVYLLNMKQTFSPLFVIKEVVGLRKLIAKEKPDIVYCHSSFAGALGRLACVLLKVKVVYNPHGWAFNMQEGSAVKRELYMIIERFLAKLTDRIVCISKAEYRSAIEKKICTPEKLRIIQNGIRISDVENAIPVNRSSLGFKQDDFVIGMIGRLTPQKAPDIFIKAGKLIKEAIPQAVFLIVGNGDETEWVIDYARQNQLNVYVTGWVDNPYSYLKTFDLAMLLSRWEGFGLSLAEYMAARKNIIATRIDAIPTLIEDGTDGLLVDVDSPEDVRAKAIYIYNHKKEADEMKDRAYQKVKTQFDIHRVAAQHVEMFKDLGCQRNIQCI